MQGPQDTMEDTVKHIPIKLQDVYTAIAVIIAYYVVSLLPVEKYVNNNYTRYICMAIRASLLASIVILAIKYVK